jgi:hypothetical protein
MAYAARSIESSQNASRYRRPSREPTARSPLSRRRRARLRRQKVPMGLVIRTIKLARAKVKIGPANLTYNMKRTLADNAADDGINKPHDQPQPNRAAHAITSQREEALNQPNPRACTSTNHHHPAKTRFLKVRSLGRLRVKMLGLTSGEDRHGPLRRSCSLVGIDDNLHCQSRRCNRYRGNCRQRSEYFGGLPSALSASARTTGFRSRTPFGMACSRSFAAWL